MVLRMIRPSSHVLTLRPGDSRIRPRLADAEPGHCLGARAKMLGVTRALPVARRLPDGKPLGRALRYAALAVILSGAGRFRVGAGIQAEMAWLIVPAVTARRNDWPTSMPGYRRDLRCPPVAALLEGCAKWVAIRKTCVIAEELLSG